MSASASALRDKLRKVHALLEGAKTPGERSAAAAAAARVRMAIEALENPASQAGSEQPTETRHRKGSRRGLGKWSNAGVPHRGWSCVDFEDLGDRTGICEMCEMQSIRFVHYMQHPDYGDVLGAGCDCAGRMSEDYDGAFARERVAKNYMARRARWLKREWRVSWKGNPWIKCSGILVVIFRKGYGWGTMVQDTVSGAKRFSREIFATVHEAQCYAFDDFTSYQ